VVTIIYQNIILLIYPTVFKDIWYLNNLSGCFILNLPIEELIFGFALGFGASSFFEIITGRIYIFKKKL
jgi:hypothetical protein